MDYPMNLISIILPDEAPENLVDDHKVVLERVARNKLTGLQRKALLGHYRDGKSDDVLGAARHKSPQTICAQRQRSVEILRRWSNLLLKDPSTDGSACFADLPARSRNALLRAGITTVEELQHWTYESLLKLPNCGVKSVDAIVSLVEMHGLKLAM